MKTRLSNPGLELWRRRAPRPARGPISALAAALLCACNSLAADPNHGATNAPALEKTAVAGTATNVEPAALTVGTNQPSRAGNRGASNPSQDFSAFKIVYERNIFDPNRRPASQGRRVVEVVSRAPKVESFSLVGTLLTASNTVAFFSGTDSAYRTTLTPQKEIAGFKLTEIHYHCVQLRDSNQVYELAIGRQMRREEGGEWKLADGVASDGGRVATRSSSRGSGRSSTSMSSGGSGEDTGSPSPEFGPPGEMGGPAADTGDRDTAKEEKASVKSSADEVLKRLMEKRQKE
jgi:hypothetical protein